MPNELDIANSPEIVQTHIGGGAMLEGVMMRGRYSWAVAVREPSGGIYVEEHDVPGYGKKQAWRRWPLVRGCVSLVESLVLQFKAMGITAAYAYDFDEEDDDNAEKGPERCVSLDGSSESAASEKYDGDVQSDDAQAVEGEGGAVSEEAMRQRELASKEAGEKGLSGWMMVSMIVGVVLGVLLFVLAPAAVTNLIIGDYQRENMFAWNLVDGFLRAGIFVLYMWLIGFMPDIKRMFGYHGAEHKTIHCVEHGLPLTPENCRQFSRQHVRCGTAFIIMTLIVSIIVFTLFPTDLVAEAFGFDGGLGRFGIVVLSRIVLIPLVAGLSYEITVRWAGRHPDNPLVKIVLAPGMAMQLITTHDPDDSMLECAIASMKAVIAREAREEGRELNEYGLPVDIRDLEGCALATDVPENRSGR